MEAGDASEALRHVDQREPDLVLLDVVMPHVDGIDLLAEIRSRSNVPVIMLTALGDEADRILGLKSGADDYMVKPFSPGELSARIESVLRRSQLSPNSVPGSATDALTFGDLEIDPRTRDVKVNGQLVALTAARIRSVALPGHVAASGLRSPAAAHAGVAVVGRLAGPRDRHRARASHPPQDRVRPRPASVAQNGPRGRLQVRTVDRVRPSAASRRRRRRARARRHRTAS